MSHAALSGAYQCSPVYGGGVPQQQKQKRPETPEENPGPSATVDRLLKRITALRRARKLNLGDMMKAAGSTQQAWSRWKHGASPRVDLLEAVARSLDADLVLDVRDRRVQEATETAPWVTPQSAEIATVVDGIHDEEIRIRIMESVHRLAHTYYRMQGAPQPARTKADKAK